MKKTSVKTMASLDSWHGIIMRKVRDAMRKAQSKKVMAMNKGLKAQIKALQDHTNEYLLDVLLHAHSNQNCYDLGERSVWEKLHSAARKEVLRRMASE